MVGLFINTLPVRVQVAPTDLLLPWLQALQAHQLEVRQYEYSSLLQIHTWSGVPQHLPLFESLMMFENYPVDISLQKVGKSLNTSHALAQKNYGHVQTEVPLAVDVRPAPELALSIFYYRSYFEDSMIARMLEQFRVLLEGIAAEPGRHLGNLMQLVDQSMLGSWENG